MIGLVKRYGTIGLVVLLALAVADIEWRRAQVANCRQDAAEAEKLHAQALSKALTDQRNALDQVLAQEERRRAMAEAKNRDLVKQVEQLRDYHEKLADSVRVYVNGLFNSARSGYGGADAEDPGIPPAGRTDAGKEPAGEGG